MARFSKNISEIIRTEHKDFASQYDYVFVFNMDLVKDRDDGVREQSIAGKHCIYSMLQAGLDIYPYLSMQEDELIVLVKASDEVLRRFADQIDFLMLCDEGYIEKTLKAGNPEYRIAPIFITDDRKITPLSPYQYIFLEYEENYDQNLYYTPPGETSPFIKSVRLKLLYSLLRGSKRQGGCDIELSHLLHQGKILAFFPLHDVSIVDQLKARCVGLGYFPWDYPTFDVKEYLGEKIALYALFLGHYSLYLVIPSIIGIAFQLVVWATLDFSSPVLPFYSLVITVWSIVMLEYWKRQESYTALTWGMAEFEAKELDRPEFIGEVIKSHIDGQDILFYPTSKLARRAAISRSIVVTFIMIVIGVVAGIYILRFQLQKQASTQSYASTVASILNAVQIQIFNAIYRKVVIILTNKENHRTDTSYEDTFIATNLNAPTDNPHNYIGQCAATNCMEPLSINLAIIYGTRLTLGNVLDILVPYFTWKSKYSRETKGVEDISNISLPERDYFLVQYNPVIESIENYSDTAVQYGYTMLFVTALPISSFLSLLNNYVKLKFFSYKIFTFYQRPIPVGAQDIGTWMLIFQFLSIASVVTNGGLICFTMNVLWGYSIAGRVWIFIGFQWVLMLCQFLATEFIDDIPPEVVIQKERNAFINLKIIDRVEDEDYGHVIDLEDVENDGNNKKVRRCCGGLIKANSTKSSKRLLRGLDAFPVLQYPIHDNVDLWPEPLNKSVVSLPKLNKNNDNNNDTNNKQGMKSNNTTGYESNKSVSVDIDSNTPPPPPGYI